MCTLGDCFIVLPPHCTENTVIFGRNSGQIEQKGDQAQEIIYYDSSASSDGKCDGGAEPEVIGSLRVILQKPLPRVWGGDYGANEKNVCIGISYSADQPDLESGHLLGTDIVRYALAAATSAADATEQIGSLIVSHGDDKSKNSFVVCDATEVWIVSSCGKQWAAQRFADGFRRISTSGLAVTQNIDRSSDDLQGTLKTLGLWNGEGNLDFAACCGASPSDADGTWFGEAPPGDGTFDLTNMFETVRSAATDKTRAATSSVITTIGISCHWFTGTPNPCESVFKPFVFAPKPKISPLTKVPTADEVLTLVHKLHAQRKATAVNDLKFLEASCVEEVNKYFSEHPSPNEELDELMKDCVEAEVKFYR